MKFNIAYPALSTQKVVTIEDEAKLRNFYDKRISQEVSGESLGDEYAGYIFKIRGGNDKDGFAMKQGVLVGKRVRVLMAKGASCYRPRRRGERKRKSVRGCIIGPDIGVINLTVVKKGDSEIEGLTETEVPRRLGPKRASRIRRLFNLGPEEDVRAHVARRKFETKKGKTVVKSPRIQRLVTDITLQRRRRVQKELRERHERTKENQAVYEKLHQQRLDEERASRRSERSKRRSSRRASDKRDSRKEN